MEEQELLTRPTLERPRTPHMQSACSCSRWIPGRPKRRDREALTRPTCCRSVAVAAEGGWGVAVGQVNWRFSENGRCLLADQRRKLWRSPARFV